jgi:hypothetical protein
MPFPENANTKITIKKTGLSNTINSIAKILSNTILTDL